MLRNYITLQQRVAEGDIVVRHVPDSENPSDFLTKWLSQEKAEASVAYATNPGNAVAETDKSFKKEMQATFDNKLAEYLARARAATGAATSAAG